jgi:hypothetical protein
LYRMLQQFTCLGWRILVLVVRFTHSMNVMSFPSIPDYLVSTGYLPY